MKKKVLENKIATAIALFLMLTMAISLVALPVTVKAQAAPTMKTYAVVDAIPNPVGVGEKFW